MHKRFRCVKKLILAMCFLLTLATTDVYANGWVDKDIQGSTIYNDSSLGTDTYEEVTDANEDEGIITAMFREFIYFIGVGIEKLSVNSNIKITIDDIVYGRMSPTAASYYGNSNIKISYAQFDLNPGNPYGVTAAHLFVLLRKNVYPLWLIYFAFQCSTNFFKNGDRGRAELKDFLQTSVICFALMYIIPYATDYAVYAKDALLYTMTKGISSITSTGAAGSTLLSAWRAMYKSDPSLVTAIMYTATAFAGFIYYANYITTAIIQTIFFAAAPLVLMLSTKNKKLLSSWAGTFFVNIAIPVIDGVLLMLPMLFIYVYDQNTNLGTSGMNGLNGIATSHNFGLMVILIIAVGAVMPARNALLRIFGAQTGLQARSGFGGMAALGMMAMRALNGMKHGGSGGVKPSDTPSVKMDKESAEAETKKGELLNEANKEIASDMGEVTDIFSDKNISSDVDGSIAPSGEFLKDDTEDFISGGGSVSEFDELPGLNKNSSDEKAAEIEAEPELVSDKNELEANSGLKEMDNVLNEDEVDSLNAPDTSKFGHLEDIEGITESVPDSRGSNIPNTPYDNIIPGFDKEYASTLSGDKLDRFANLSSRDAMQKELRENAAFLNENKEKKPQLQAEQRELRDRNANIDAEISQIENNPLMKTDVGYQLQNSGRLRELKTEKAANTSRLNTVNENLSRIHNVEARNQQLHGGIEKTNKIEASFAKAQEAVGMSGKTYDSAAAYKLQNQVNDIDRSQINSANFDSGKYNAILSPQEKAAYYAERAEAHKYDTVKTVAKTAGTVALGTAGAVAGIYGGPQGMVIGAAGFVYGGEKLASGAMNVGKSVATGAVETARAGIEKGTQIYQAAKPQIQEGLREVKAYYSEPNVTTPKATHAQNDGMDMLSEQRKFIDEYNSRNGS